MITLKTNYGDIKIELDFDNTPITANNFLSYAKKDFYKDTIFHRVIDGFMIQGGGFTKDMKQKTGDALIENEADKGGKNNRGTLAMARTNDPHSASSQFFINVKDNAFLNHRSKDLQGWGYCVFGQVTEGLDVIDKIKVVKTTSKAGHADVPVEDVIIEAVIVE
jgi:peptidyl-prolyl cis-trans isomerase B (cyclophilin B)